uniref:alpha-ketoglutarate-dependent dioxygenase AlkB n=1 Tax=Pseudomonas sp. TaxID=306 RepID=UPI00272C7522
MSGTLDLFDRTISVRPLRIAEGAWLLRGFALDQAETLLDEIARIAQQTPFRHQITPGGFRMSAAMTSCGALGWVTDRAGYRYSGIDPDSGKSWPEMPAVFRDLAARAATESGYEDFQPQGCLINRYETGARMSLHQDKDEQALDAPIVSVSLGAPMTFLFGGLLRADPTSRYRLEHGDIV